MAGDEQTFYRPDELARRPAMLAASHYNMQRTLVAASERGCVFVPIRSMQYMAVADAEETIFVDGATPHLVDLAWQHYRPGEREGLDEPVPYELVIYNDKALKLLGRLQGEYHAALELLVNRERDQRADKPGKVIPGRFSGD